MNRTGKLTISLSAALTLLALGFAIVQQLRVAKLEGIIRELSSQIDRETAHARHRTAKLEAHINEAQINEAQAEITRLDSPEDLRQAVSREIPRQQVGNSMTPRPWPAPGTRPDPVVGSVTAAKDTLVEVSIGSDDGILRGHVLEVSRQTGGTLEQLGHVRVVRADPDRAIARRLSGTAVVVFQPGDRVVAE